LDIDYKVLLIDYKRLQKLDIDYKVLLIDYKRLQNLLIDYKRLQNLDIDYKILLIPLTTVIDIYLLGPRVIQSQPAAPSIQGRYLMGNWWRNVEKYCRNYIPFLVWGILSIGEQHRPKPTKGVHFRDFIHIYLSRPSIRKVCSVHFLELQKFVVSTFWDYKILWCLLFGTTKVCSVCFLGVQKFVVSSPESIIVMRHSVLSTSYVWISLCNHSS